MNTKIVHGKSSDWKEYKKLRLGSLKECPVMFGSLHADEIKLPDTKWQERVSGPTNLTLFAKDQQNLVGMITCYWDHEHQTKQHIANIVGFYVETSFRDKGIGEKLLQELLMQIRERKQFKKVKLSVNILNHGAIHLYEKLGFRKVGTLEKEIKIKNKYYDEYLMEKLV